MKKEEVHRGMVLAERDNGGGTLIIRLHHLDEDGRVYCEAACQGKKLFKSEYKNDGKNCGHISEFEKATFEQKRHLEELIREKKSREKKEEISRVHVLGEMVADLKVENIQLTRRVHELMDNYNRVVRQLQDKEKHESSPTGYTLGELTEALDKCESLEKDNKLLKQQCIQLRMERNEAKTHVADCEHQKEELFKQISRFNNSEFLKFGVVCSHRVFAPGDNPVMVGSDKCCNCRHLVKVDVFGKKCVLCAVRYDNTKEKEAQENKNSR